jgi:hypothetical protein
LAVSFYLPRKEVERKEVRREKEEKELSLGTIRTREFKKPADVLVSNDNNIGIDDDV